METYSKLEYTKPLLNDWHEHKQKGVTEWTEEWGDDNQPCG
jgi:hypothetical protein